MSFTNLITIDTKASSSHDANAKLDISKVPIKEGKRGCEYCTLNKVKGINKIFGKVRGRDIFIWAQSPGPKENNKERVLIGPSGEWLWKELLRVGISRDDVDIQNVVRCMPADRVKSTWPPFKMRAPSKLEIKCCSLYNDKAIEKSKARLHLVFGKIAASAVLKKEFKKDQRIFYSDVLKGWVVYLDHPSWFIRQGYTAGDDKAPNESLLRFRRDLDKAKQLLTSNNFDRYAYLKKQKYIAVMSSEQSKIVYRKLVKKGLQGHCLIADMEEGKIDDNGQPDDKGKTVALCAGFSYKPGKSYVFPLDHPNTGISDKCKRLNRLYVQRLFTDSRLAKGFHYGISDTDAIKRFLGVTVRKYNYDTLLASYFKDPNAKKYGLAAIAERHYPEFLDYKSIEAPEAFTSEFVELLKDKKYKKLTSLPQQIKFARTKRGALNLSRMPWEKMVLYNGADCDLEKRVELDTRKYVSQPLMQVYIDAAYILKRMETNKGCLPIFDYHWHRKIAKVFKLRKKRLLKQIFKLSGKYVYLPLKKDRVQWVQYLEGKVNCPEVHKKDFNPGSPDHIMWLLWDKLGYTFRPKDKGDKPNTRASTLLTLALKHKKAKLIVDYRQCIKAEGTYVEGYLKCANLNKGHLRTNWKMTGTSTGRLSSGKTADKKNDAVINFQNIHGDELIKCLLISDKRYRDIFEHWIMNGDFDKRTWKQFKDVYVDLGYDFSQNELRQLAEESGDKNLIRAFATTKKWYCKQCKTKHKSDPHVEVGHELTGWPREQIAHNDHVRKLVKNMQFGLVYGLQGEGLFSFITMLGVKTTLEEVNKYHAKYFAKYDGVRKLQEAYRTFVKKHGYVKNIFGFRRNLDTEAKVPDDAGMLDTEEGDGRKGAYWGNQAINTPIQGAAHQLLMMAIAALYRYPKKYKLLKNPNKEVHDAIYFRLKLKYLFKAIKQGLDLMLNAPVKIVEEDFKIKKLVPLAAKPKAGFRFGVMVEFEDEITNEWEFLNAWCKANKNIEFAYKQQMKVLTKAA
jgi:uracil-DNA glycosylase family 4